MKRYLLLPLTLICWSLSAQQTTFNSREHLDSEASILTNVITTDSCYYACGIISPPDNPENCFLWTKWDLEGALLSHFTICDPEIDYFTYYQTLHDLGNGEFAAAGVARDDIPRNFYMRFNLEGEIINYNAFPNFYPTSSNTALLDMTQVADGFLMVANGDNANGVSPGWTNNFLIKVDENGEEFWQKAFGTEICDLGYTLLNDQFSNDVYLFTRVYNRCIQNMALTQKTFIYKIDENGNEELLKELGSAAAPTGKCQAAVQLSDGSIILGTGNASNNSQSIVYDNQIVKLNPNLEIEWEATIGTNYSTTTNEIRDLLILDDEAAFIAVGQTRLLTDNSLTPNLAQISKVSTEGEALWTRHYQWGNAIGQQQNHSFFDLDLTPDGGFVCVGGSADQTISNEPSDQAWLIKLDEQGCLVPDCHLIDTTSLIPEPFLNISLEIYPNPSTDYINIFYRNTQHTNDGVFKIINAMGQLVYETKPALSEVTVVVPCSEWQAGAYFVQYWEDGRVSRAQQVVVK